MDGFKNTTKIKYFKVGGSVSNEKFKPSGDAVKTIKTPVTGDKKAKAKSAPVDKEAKVDITTMKKGGRAKKATGTVKKFVKAAAPSKAATKSNFKGSDVSKTNKLKSGDKDKIKKVKPTGDKKAAAPSKAKTKGKEIKKFADGGLTGTATDPSAGLQATNTTQTQLGTIPGGAGPSDLPPAFAVDPQMGTIPGGAGPSDLPPPGSLGGPLGPIGAPLNAPSKPIMYNPTSGPTNLGPLVNNGATTIGIGQPALGPQTSPAPTPAPITAPAPTPAPITAPRVPNTGRAIFGHQVAPNSFNQGNPFQGMFGRQPTPNPINSLTTPTSPLPGRRFKTGGKVK